VNAQSITPVINGTGTQVIQFGNTYTIQGGAVSSDRANLFHQFEKFGLNANEIANFLANPQTRNIFGSVGGGNPSIIDGLIRVTGGNPNLFLSNPAGILFGANAKLDIPGSLTVTTANGISFGDKWLSVLGSNNYAAFVGNPTGFTFTMAQPGGIANEGNLSVPTGQSVMLVGGTVLNTGTISAPGGNITIAAVPGTNRVRISQEGRLLSLELAADKGTSGVQSVPFSPRMLPDLLTSGRVPILDVPIPTEGGTAIVSGQLSVAGNQSTNQTPQINILGQKVGLVDARVDASGGYGGGTIRIGGDYQGKGTVFNSDRTFISSNSVINADALNNGNGGRIVVWSNDATRFYGTLTAKGGVNGGNGGFSEVSGKTFLDYVGKADLSAAQGKFGTLLLDPTDITVIAGASNPAELIANDQFADPGVNNTITNGTINAATANVILQATNNIVFGAPINIAAPGVGLTAQANNNISVTANVTTNGGNVTLNADADIQNGGTLTIANATITTQGGSFTGTGRGQNTIADSNGISLNASTINTRGGNIAMIGIGGTATNPDNTVNANNGIAVNPDTILETIGNGSITLTGTGGTGANNSVGISTRARSRITSENGAIQLIGQGGGDGTGNRNVGAYLGFNAEGNSIQTTGSGSVSVQGTAGTGSSQNTGIELYFSTINVADGDITLRGIANGTLGFNTGLEILSSTVRTTSTVPGRGNIALYGKGSNFGAAGAQNPGIAVTGLLAGLPATIAAEGAGNIEVEGIGGVSYFNSGGFGLGRDSTLRSNDGDIRIRGVGGAGNSSGGIGLSSDLDGVNQRIVSTGRGNIFLEGIGGTDGINPGITIGGALSNRATIEASGSGSISLKGIGANGARDIDLTSKGSVVPNSNSVLDLTGNITFTEPVTLNVARINHSGGTLSTTGNFPFTLQANQVTVGSITNPGQPITIISNSNLTTGDLNSSSPTTGGGAVSLTSSRGAITTGNLNSFGTTGGAIALDARTAITTGAINSSGIIGSGGNVILDPIGDIQIASINAQGGIIGRGGNVDITAGQFFRATGVFSDRNNTLASISTAGGQGGGSIIIRHGTGTLGLPFNIGDPSRSGTAGAITSGAFRIEPQQQLIGPFTLGNIQLITTVPQPPPEKRPSPAPTPEPPKHPEAQYFPVLDPGIYDGPQGGIDKQLATPIQRFYQPPVPSSANLDPTLQPSVRSPGNSRQAIMPTQTAPSTSQTPSTSVAATPAVQNPGASTTSVPSSTSQTPGTGTTITPPSTSQTPSTGVADSLPLTSQTPGAGVAVAPTIENPKPRTLSDVRNQLTQIEQATGVRPALIYAVFTRTTPLIDSPASRIKSRKSAVLWKFNASTTSLTLSEAVATAQASPQDNDRLELILVTANGSVVRKPVILDDTHQAVTRKAILEQVDLLFQMSWEEPKGNEEFKQRTQAQSLYQSLVQPLENELQSRGVGNLVFLMDQGLRRVPIAALHDGKQYLVEKYSLGLSPSLSLTDTRYADPRKAQLLAMGRSDFSDEQDYRDHNLPGTGTEIKEILQIWNGSKPFLDRDFTQKNLLNERQSKQYGIIHLATHATFDEDLQKSHIQLWGSRLTLNDISTLRWYNPPVELVVLSACQTAKDSKDAELGFAGFAVRSGAKSALASIWSVNDASTTSLMIEFYQQLHHANTRIKAEALRRAQIAMIKGKLKIENGQLTGLGKPIALPKEFQNVSNLSHPYYWAGFTMIGSPW